MQCSTLNIQVGLNIGDRDYFRKAQETRDFVFSDYLFGKTNNRPIMMAAYPVSAINPEEDVGGGRRHQSRLAVEDHGQPRRTAGHFMRC